MALQTIHGNSVEISGVSKNFKAFKAIDDVSLTVAAGEFLALLGPSSGGKTTILRMIAGLVTPDAGSIRFDDTMIFDAAGRTNVPAERRNIGMVFQDYALWPHMRVRDNVGFPLRARNVPKERHAQMIERALARVELGHLGHRFPGELSGGQQQRVALARATVDEPRLLLFDEPLSNLDAALRESLGREIKALVNSLGATAVYVTHDQSEAFGLADRVAVVREGRLVQQGAPHDLYQHPNDVWMARFLRSGNLIAGVAGDGRFRPQGLDHALVLPELLNGHAGPATLLIPGHALRVAPGTSDIRLRVISSQFRGDRYEIAAYLGDGVQTAPVIHFWHDRAITPGERVSAGLDHAKLKIFQEELT